MERTFKRNLLVSSGISILILLISSIASYFSINSLLKSNQMVNHTQDVIYALNESNLVLVDAQSGLRAYLVSGDEKFLRHYYEGLVKNKDLLDKLQELTSDNQTQQQRIADIRILNTSFFDYITGKIQAKRNGDVLNANQIHQGKVIMDAIRAAYRDVEATEKVLLKDRADTSERFGTYSLILIIVAAVIAIAISLLFFTRTLRDFAARIQLVRQLEKNEREIAERIRIISNVAGQIADGNYKIRVDTIESDALGSMGESLNDMAIALEKSFRSLSEKEWQQAGIAELNMVMIGEKDINQLCSDVVTYLAEYTSSNAAILYLMEGDALVDCCGYGHIPEQTPHRIAVGEGLTGQAVASRKMVSMNDLSETRIKVSYALGEALPKQVVALPLIDGLVAGAIELASIKGFEPRELEFLNAVTDNIAIAIKAAENRKRVQELLEETEAQSEELRTQHSELEGMNAELEVQAEKLQASEEELRVQQEELQQTNEELSERGALLEERNLEIQKKSEDLELTTRYKSEFLANMSHELRTPLNSILLLSRLLSENNDKNMNDEQIEFAKVIQSSGNGLLGLIDEILDLSKIESGKMELEVDDIGISEIADNLKNLFTVMAKEKGIGFSINLEKAPMVIKTDQMRLEQILKNLLSNAIKFTMEGEVSLTIVLDKSSDKKVAFVVKDTGIGIARDKQPLIFEAFQQADGSTKRKYGGTGLGLSISRELAKLLGGEIFLKSNEGEGSEFTLYLPLVAHTAEPFDSKEIHEPYINEATPVEKPQTAKDQYISPFIPEDIEDDRDNLQSGDRVILIVEDDVNFAKSLLEFTRERGYKGISAVRGDYALNLALLYKPVGILLDIELPIKSGWDVMEELKSHPQTKPIPVHIMSSHKLKRESLLKGAVNFLDKPVAFEKLPEVFKKIEHFIQRESQKVLIMEDNPKHAKALAYFLETNSINSEITSDIDEGVQALQRSNVDCVILDMGIPDQQAYEILESIKQNEGLENLPVIVFTGKSLSMIEELKIKKYADSIIVKTAYSYQRMLDEVSLFLHLVEEGKQETHKKRHQLNNVLNNKTVLVVDDDVRNIYSLTKALESLKMNVITAIDGREALRALDENPKVDVVLLDMMMPNLDGYETATLIRKQKKWKNLPVIAVTAKAMTGDREKCINAGASDYITKPVDVDQLLSLLRVWLYDK